MPGPGLDLIGDEEIAEVTDVLRTHHLSRFGRDDDPTFGAKVRHVEEEVARLAGVGYALATNSGSSSLWLAMIGLDPCFYGTHSLRRTKATLIYKKTGNLRAVQLLLGHTKIESTVRYLGIEVDDALAVAEQIDV